MGRKMVLTRANARKGYVRCLGPGPEHMFMSRDVCNNRICPECTARLESLRVGIGCREIIADTSRRNFRAMQEDT